MGVMCKPCPETSRIVASADSLGGVAVLSVREDSPAAEAGVRRGDILLRVADRDVRTLADYVDACRTGSGQLPLLLVRAGTLVELQVELGAAARHV